MKVMATISSLDYLPQSIASLSSAKRFYSDCDFVILVTTMRDVSVYNQILARRGIQVINLQTVADYGHADSILYKYATDALRWALKPSLLLYLLDKYDVAVYSDNDIVFFDDWAWIWEIVTKHDMTITPHRSNIVGRHIWNDGIYNAGFVGASRGGLPTIAKWDELCNWRCEKSPEHGLYVDQKYLDAFPTICNCKILTHNGCNVASWNVPNSVIEQDGKSIRVNKDPLIFIHLSGGTHCDFIKPFMKKFYEEVEVERYLLNHTDPVGFV